MTAKALFNNYVNDLAKVAQQGDSREESFYPALQKMLYAVAEAEGRKQIHVTTQPTRTDAGNPDFRLWNGRDRVVGYVEAKKPSEHDLDDVQESKQLARYLATFPNVILTNFLEFRLYRNGDMVLTARLGRSTILNRLKTAPPIEEVEELYQLLDKFMSFQVPQVQSAEALAVELAKRTRFLRGVVEQELKKERNGHGALVGFYDAFKTYLIGTMSPSEFADLFSQTITYGLFAARTRSGKDFSRRVAFDAIPHTIGILRQLFRFISLDDLPSELAWCVEDIAEILAVTDARGILDRFYKEGEGNDPIVPFYETFLAKYDPDERERLGVYYTPEQVVGYIVRSVHELLKSSFRKPEGLASEGVTLLDPAAGTMTFVAHATRQAVVEFEKRYGKGKTRDFIRKHVLKNFYAFELMMAPYAVGHLKMGFLLQELGHELMGDERVRFFLTNALDMGELEESSLPGFSALAEESHDAGKVKKETPILVVIGNPPYSGQSSNPSEAPVMVKKGHPYVCGWIPKAEGGAAAVERVSKRDMRKLQPTFIGRLIRDYFFVDGQPLGEKNPKWLHDDYVKFLRLAQWKIEQAKFGVIGMITNHSYLENPTFRGMRRSLMRSFDEIYVLDLHGNALKKETCPDGSPDQNVFDIRQGVAVAFLVKRQKTKAQETIVRHAELFGKRQHKNTWLETFDLSTTKWTTVKPQSPSYLFVSRDDALVTTFERYPAVPEIFPVNSVGVVTARDSLAIQWNKDDMWGVVTAFSHMDPELARDGYNLGKDARDWKVALAQQDLIDSGPNREKIVPIFYRPFDIRYTYYSGKSRGFICMPRGDVMRHMLVGETQALVLPKRVEHVGAWRNAFVSSTISDHVAVSLKTIDYHFPLYLYPKNKEGDLFAHQETTTRYPNLNGRMVATLKRAYGAEPSTENIFHYVYAVLYAPTYREKYVDMLRADFPRIPFTKDGKLFRKLAKLGRRLTSIHLLTSDELNPPSCRFEGKGDSSVLKERNSGLRYEVETESVYVNTTQYFAPVSKAVWEYQIGGYRVCEKWLKDRRGRRLSLDEVRTYCRIVTALGLTIIVQDEINELYPKVEKAVIDFGK